jgi:hypothetical protein
LRQQNPPDLDEGPSNAFGVVTTMTHQPDIDREQLGDVARKAIDDGYDLDSFMKAAWTAYVDSRPGLREELEEKRVIAGLVEMRKRGLVPTA